MGPIITHYWPPQLADETHKWTVFLEGVAGTMAQSQGVASMQMVNHKYEENCYPL